VAAEDGSLIAGWHRPKPRGIVRIAGAGSEALPVRAEGQRPDEGPMAAKAPSLGAGLHVPEVDRVIYRRVGEVPAIVRENGSAHVSIHRLTRKAGAFSSRRDVPELGLRVSNTEEQAAVWAEQHTNEDLIGNSAKDGPIVPVRFPRQQSPVIGQREQELIRDVRQILEITALSGKHAGLPSRRGLPNAHRARLVRPGAPHQIGRFK
jgi:hypothetical protein